MTHRVAVVGASGFVGRGVTLHLRGRGVDVVEVRAPRLTSTPEESTTFHADPEVLPDLIQKFEGCTAVVNCAGNPDASSRDASALFGANALLPGVIATAARRAGAGRFVHVSSAVVQGRVDRLDASMTFDGRSVYAQSKIAGEQGVRASDAPPSTIIYRPPSVHGQERRVTRSIARLARSPLASVVGQGTSPTPQAHIDNVAAAIAELALTRRTDIPPVVIHPWEGWTTGDLMRTFGGGREPLHIPSWLGPVIRGCLALATRSARLAPNARRVEMMWFGQGQEVSWLSSTGWTPPAERDSWIRMLDGLATKAKNQEEDEFHT